MPEIENREAKEGAMTSALLAAWEPHSRSVLAGREPDWDRLAQDTAEAAEEHIASAQRLAAVLLWLLMIDDLKSLAGDLDGVNSRKIAEEASTTSRSGPLGRDVAATSRDRWRDLLQASRADWRDRDRMARAAAKRSGAPYAETGYPGPTDEELAHYADVNFARQRATNISGTEITGAGFEGERIARGIIENRGLGLVGYWVTENKPCPICASLNGKSEEVWMVLFPNGPPSPHPNCLLGDTPVVVPGVRSAVRARYRGPVVRIKTRDGSSVTVTPNHMLLTSRGFVRSADLVNGCDIVRARGAQRAISPIDPNYNRQPALAEQVFHAAAIASGVAASRVPAAAEYLHGDAALCDGEIDVVNTEGLLRYGSDAAIFEPSPELGFVLSELAYRFDREGSLGLFGCPLHTAASGAIGGVRERAAILNAQAFHAEIASLGPGSRGESRVRQSSADYSPRDFEFAADAQYALPGEVTLSEVVAVEFDTLHEFTCVYDFETESSLYTVGDGLVSSNCKCHIRYEPVRTRESIAIAGPWRIVGRTLTTRFDWTNPRSG